VIPYSDLLQRCLACHVYKCMSVIPLLFPHLTVLRTSSIKMNSGAVISPELERIGFSAVICIPWPVVALVAGLLLKVLGCSLVKLRL